MPEKPKRLEIMKGGGDCPGLNAEHAKDARLGATVVRWSLVTSKRGGTPTPYDRLLAPTYGAAMT